ncbi:hypothetical protein ACFZCU_21880 [Streptomyces canus]|uniref:hypothetical protein n=1 Tax=Streptomyces canus TaxID=58343 RepID=UPI0036E2D029
MRPWATAGVDVVVGLGDVVQRVTVADGSGGVRSRAAWRLATAGKSSLPSSRRVTLLNSSGQKGISGRSARVA